MIRVLIVDDSAVVRNGLERLVADQADLQVAGEAKDGIKALGLLKTGLTVDVILTDLDMPAMNGLELTHQVTLNYPDLPVIILTMHLHQAYRKQAAKAGAKAYLLKDHDEEALYRCIRAVYEGQSFLDSDRLD